MILAAATTINLTGANMDKDQEVLKELLKLKLFLVQKLNSHTFAVMTQDVLDKVNGAIENVSGSKP